MECGIGFAGPVHLFSTPQTLPPLELNGVQLVESLWVRALRFRRGVTPPDAPRLGVEVGEEEIRRYAVDF